jgi:hypothetical protein
LTRQVDRMPTVKKSYKKCHPNQNPPETRAAT